MHACTVRSVWRLCRVDVPFEDTSKTEPHVLRLLQVGVVAMMWDPVCDPTRAWTDLTIFGMRASPVVSHARRTWTTTLGPRCGTLLQVWGCGRRMQAPTKATWKWLPARCCSRLVLPVVEVWACTTSPWVVDLSHMMAPSVTSRLFSTPTEALDTRWRNRCARKRSQRDHLCAFAAPRLPAALCSVQSARMACARSAVASAWRKRGFARAQPTPADVGKRRTRKGRTTRRDHSKWKTMSVRAFVPHQRAPMGMLALVLVQLLVQVPMEVQQ